MRGVNPSTTLNHLQLIEFTGYVLVKSTARLVSYINVLWRLKAN